jgi:hypothetical protein
MSTRSAIEDLRLAFVLAPSFCPHRRCSSINHSTFAGSHLHSEQGAHPIPTPPQFSYLKTASLAMPYLLRQALTQLTPSPSPLCRRMSRYDASCLVDDPGSDSEARPTSSGRYHLHPTRRSTDPSRRSSIFIPKRSSSSRCFPNSPTQYSSPLRAHFTR